MTEPAADALEPDTKDWTWTLDRACPDCGFEAGAVARQDLVGLVGSLTEPWAAVLARPDAAQRPGPATWSPLEYGCHVRDVCALFDERTRLVLAEDDPTFANWDQDETAVAARYADQDPAVVAGELASAAAAWGATVAGLAGAPQDVWERTATRSNGSRFTTLSLLRYGLHDLAHHLHDVGAAPQ